MYNHPQQPSNEPLSNQPSNQPSNQSPGRDRQVTLDFVQRILSGEDGYCWEPSAPGSDDYLDQLEHIWLSQSEDVLQSDLDDTQFFATLDRAWAAVDGTMVDLETELMQSLGDRIPQQTLQNLLIKAKQAFQTQESLGRQLVQCVQGLVPQLDVDDLQIMARPYTLAMRNRQSSPSLDTLSSSVRVAQWDELIPVERARLGLEVTHYILSQLPHYFSEPS